SRNSSIHLPIASFILGGICIAENDKSHVPVDGHFPRKNFSFFAAGYMFPRSSTHQSTITGRNEVSYAPISSIKRIRDNT
ncbi:hypothetical protein ACEUDQ_04805, partial [Aeromonas caviae]|uniref:hypothetical protein n=1 Tax=Aeromonas caviae TaxID=648 RepID=UPI0038D172E4